MLTDAALVVASNAVDAAVSHMQAHSGARGASGTTNAVGSRVSVNGTVDADGDIVWVANFTGLNPNQAVAEISLWSAATNGTYYGGGALGGGGDTTANSAGEFTATWTENLGAS